MFINLLAAEKFSWSYKLPFVRFKAHGGDELSEFYEKYHGFVDKMCRYGLNLDIVPPMITDLSKSFEVNFSISFMDRLRLIILLTRWKVESYCSMVQFRSN